MTSALYLGKRIERADSGIGGPSGGGKFLVPLEIATQTLGILGQRGSGKSNTQVVLAEAFYDAGIPWVAIDPKGDWWGIRASADGEGEGLPIPILGGLHGDVSIASTEGAQWADVIVDANLTCVVDVSDFSKGERGRFLVDFFDRLYRRHRQDPQARHVFLEEAHEYIPQMVGREDGKLKEAASRIVLQGRSFGLGASACSQRSARLHKDVLMQIGTLIAHRTTGPLDRKAIEGWIVEHEQRADLIESLPSLGNGEAWVWSPEFLAEISRVQFLRRRTFDSGATPIVGAQARQITTLAQVDLAAIKEQMAESLERAKAEDPKELNKRIRELERELSDLKMWEPPTPVIIEGLPELLSNKLVAKREMVLASATAFAQGMGELCVLIDEAIDLRDPTPEPPTSDVPSSDEEPNPATPQVAAPRPAPAPRPQPARASSGPGADLPSAQRKLLTTLAVYGACSLRRLAMLSGYAMNGGGLNQALKGIRDAAFVDPPKGEPLAITQAGLDALGAYDPLPSGRDLLDHWIAKLPDADGKLLGMIAQLWPEATDKESLAAAAGYAVNGGGFNQPMSRLRRAGLITRSGPIRLTDEIGEAIYG